jgi:hypothetical protein
MNKILIANQRAITGLNFVKIKKRIKLHSLISKQFLIKPKQQKT